MKRLKTSNSITENEAKLIKLIKTGSDSAFEALVKYNFNRLYQIAYCILRSHHDAEEVVQDALLRAYKNLEKFRGDSLLLTWLSRIVINLACSKYQANRRRDHRLNISIHSPEEAVRIPLMLHARQINPHRQLANDEMKNWLFKELDSLPEILSQTLQMRYLANLSYDEIARRQHCSLGTVKSRISRGRKLLIQRLTARGISPSEYH